MSWTELNNIDAISLFAICNTCEHFDLCYIKYGKAKEGCLKIQQINGTAGYRYKLIESVLTKNNIKTFVEIIAKNKDFINKYKISMICGSYSSREVFVATSDFNSKSFMSFDDEIYDICEHNNCSNMMVMLMSEQDVINNCFNKHTHIDYKIEF